MLQFMGSQIVGHDGTELNHIFFIHSSVNGHLGCFHVLLLYQRFNKHWDVCILSDHVFLWIYA